MSQHLRLLSGGLAAAVLILTLPVAAQAATTSISDPAGDGSQGKRLDVVSATLNNKAKAIKIDVEVVKVAKGDLVVFLKLKGHKLIRAVSEYRPKQGTLNNFILGGDDPKGNRTCPGFTAAWSTSEDTISLRIPARCLDGGDYEKARFKILTEIGPDADLAPSTPEDEKWRWSSYAARG